MKCIVAARYLLTLHITFLIGCGGQSIGMPGQHQDDRMEQDGHFLYFAYGSNMSVPRLTARERAPSATPMGIAHVSGRRLTFDKAGRDGSGKCDCEYTGLQRDRVYGIVFLIKDTERAALDRVEGAGSGYDAVDLMVEMSGKTVTALTYIATNKDATLVPYDWYKHHVLKGARDAGLPTEYIEAINAATSHRDQDKAREARERALV